jgi:DNA-binding HxlR family transcriptional regulator
MRHYGEFLGSGEGIATNILADRLEKLEGAGILEWRADPAHQGKKIYSLTEKGLDLLPMLLEMILWGAKYDRVTEAPPDFIRRLKKDRNAVILEIRRGHLQGD